MLAIDPGNEQSAYVLYDPVDGKPAEFCKIDNYLMLALIAEAPALGATRMAVEMIASYGMPVGREVFETCLWIGRFMQAWSAGDPRADAELVYRRDVKLHLCGSARAKDPNVRQALIDRYGPGKETAIGKKATPGPLYGMAGDCWSALAVAVTTIESEALRELATA